MVFTNDITPAMKRYPIWKIAGVCVCIYIIYIYVCVCVRVGVSVCEFVVRM